MSSPTPAPATAQTDAVTLLREAADWIQSVRRDKDDNYLAKLCRDAATALEGA